MASEASVKALRRLRHHLALLAGPVEDNGDASGLAIQYTAGDDNSSSYKCTHKYHFSCFQAGNFLEKCFARSSIDLLHASP
jgi:hypothetical protein